MLIYDERFKRISNGLTPQRFINWWLFRSVLQLTETISVCRIIDYTPSNKELLFNYCHIVYTRRIRTSATGRFKIFYLFSRAKTSGITDIEIDLEHAGPKSPKNKPSFLTFVVFRPTSTCGSAATPSNRAESITIAKEKEESRRHHRFTIAGRSSCK